MKISCKKISVLLIVLFLVVANWPVLAQALDSQLQSQKSQLEQQLKDIEAQIAQYESQLSATKKQSDTLKNKIQQLKTTQAKLTLQLKETALQLQSTNSKITEIQDGISRNNKVIETLREQIAEVLRQIYILDNRDLILYVLSINQNLSSYLDDLNYFDNHIQELSQLVNAAHLAEFDLTNLQNDLIDQRDYQEGLVKIQKLQSEALTQSIQSQNTLLTKTKGQEASYTSLISDKKKEAQTIRNRIYELFSTTGNITFGQAVDIAQTVSKQTGVRTAFLLAILTQESNLGKNVGTCNRAGDPPEKGWRVIMKPERDQQPFLQITKELGLDPDTTAVSCPMKDKNGNQIGWGGAMGPAQFIPSTWMGYKSKVAAITGQPANPWLIRDAFVAAAIKLKADGAGTKDGEWKAAMLYFSGSTNTQFRFYADNVLDIAEKYETDISKLNY